LKTNIKISIIIIGAISLLMTITTPYVYGEEGATNYVFNPITNSSGVITTFFTSTVNIKTNIVTGTTYSGSPPPSCSQETYTFSYQNNVVQKSDGSWSWIQQALIVGQSASCYTIEFWPNLATMPNTADTGATMETQYPTLWTSAGTQLAFEIDGRGNPTTSHDNVNDFLLSATGAHSVSTYIYPNQINNTPTITYYHDSQQDFGIVGPCDPLICPTTTFTGGSGTITYSKVNPFTGACTNAPGQFMGGSNGLCYQTGEDSNMLYSYVSSHEQGFGLASLVQYQHNSGAGVGMVQVNITPQSTSDTLLIAVGSNINSVQGVTDNRGSIYNELPPGSATGTPNNAYSSIWYGHPADSGFGITITVTMTGSAGDADVFVYEINNIQSGTIYVSNGHGTYSSTPSVGSMSPSTSGFALGVFGDSVGCGTNLGAGTGFIIHQGLYRGASEYSVPSSGVSTTVPFSGSFTCSSSGYVWSESAAVFLSK